MTDQNQQTSVEPISKEAALTNQVVHLQTLLLKVEAERNAAIEIHKQTMQALIAQLVAIFQPKAA